MARRTIDRETFVAYHEAGHAVVAMLCERPFEYVTIERNERSAGHIKHELDDSDPLPDCFDFLGSDELNKELGGWSLGTLHQSLVVTLAGEAATFILTGDRDPEGAGESTDSKPIGDAWAVEDILSRMFGDDDDELKARKALEDWLWHLKLRTLRREWDGVERVAAALLDRKRLTYDECMAARDAKLLR